jgi:hypothetical protein
MQKYELSDLNLPMFLLYVRMNWCPHVETVNCLRNKNESWCHRYLCFYVRRFIRYFLITQ